MIAAWIDGKLIENFDMDSNTYDYYQFTVSLRDGNWVEISQTIILFEYEEFHSEECVQFLVNHYIAPYLSLHADIDGGFRVLLKDKTRKCYVSFFVQRNEYYDIDNWCHENCSGNFNIRYDAVTFSEKTDAVMFKLFYE